MSQVRALTRLLAPVHGEAFASYINRLAAFHNVDLLVMLQSLGMINQERNQRIKAYGILLDEERLKNFSVATQLPPHVVSSMLLSSYSGVAIDLTGVPPNSPDLLRRRAISEWAYFYGSHACPHCIKENGGAWQIAWKLPWSFACANHKCYLVAHCPACKRRLASGKRDRTLTPLFVKRVPKPNFCNNPQPDGVGRLGRSSEPCGHDLTSIPTVAASFEKLQVQMLLNERLSGQLLSIPNSEISAQQYFRDLRSLCAFILYCAEAEDLGHLPAPEKAAFAAFTEKRDRILLARQESSTPRNSERMRLICARQESPELMSAIVELATGVLESTSDPIRSALLRPLTTRLIERTKDRWEVIKFFGFSSLLAPLIEKNTALGSQFDRAIGFKAVISRENLFSFGSQHVPQLLWKREFDQRFKAFFPHVQENSARRFCAMALVKLGVGHTWGQSALELELPVKAGIKMANQCMTILGATGLKEAFGEELRTIAISLSKRNNKIDYCKRRGMLSTFSDIPIKNWSEICCAADIDIGQPGRRSRYAAVWLWTELTGGDWRLAPGLADENTESARTVYSKLCRTILPKLAPHLRAYGATLLQARDHLNQRVSPIAELENLECERRSASKRGPGTRRQAD